MCVRVCVCVYACVCKIVNKKIGLTRTHLTARIQDKDPDRTHRSCTVYPTMNLITQHADC